MAVKITGGTVYPAPTTTGSYKGDWQAGTAYAVNDLARYDGVLFVCTTGHTSGSTFAPTNWAPTRTGVRFRGVWQTGTVYKRGDVVIDPTTTGGSNPTLRYANKDHTATGVNASWNTGNAYSTTTVQWMPLAASAGFRGQWQAGVWYVAGELIVEPTGGTIVQSLWSHASGASYDPTQYGPLIVPLVSPVRADLLLPPAGIPDFGPLDVAGLWPKRSRIKVPQGKWLKLTPDATSVASTSGTGSLSTDTDPPGPGGALAITFPQSPVFSLAATVDLTANIFRLYTKLTGSVPPPSNGNPGLWPNTILNDIYLSVSSDNFASGNYHRVRLVHSGDTTNIIPTGAWWWQGAGPAEWVAVGTGATLGSINSFRLDCTGTSAVTMSVFGATLVPNGQQPNGVIDAARKAKVVLIFDDDYDAAWVTALAKMIPYGFPGTLVSTIAQTAPSASGALSGGELRHMTTAHGWQVATHAYSNDEHNNITDATNNVIAGTPLRAQFMKSRHAQHVHGTNGGDDFGMFGNNAEMSADFLRAVRQSFRSGRRFIGSPRLVEALPPIDPHLLWGWGSSSGDAADASDKLAYVDRAIAQKGLATFTYHSGVWTEFDALLAGLDSRRTAGTLDVVTMAEALAPWTVAP